MKTTVDTIYNELDKKEILWDRVEEYIVSLGDYINYYDEEYNETILSEAYQCHGGTGYNNVRLTELFIKNGFDVDANDGKNGASCLESLCWSSYDKYVLHVAEILLDAGADSTISCEDDEEEERGVLGTISWKSGYWNIGEYESANMFEAYRKMIERHQAGKAYKGIRAFRDSVGEVVTKVEKLQVYNWNNELRAAYLLHCGELKLFVNDYVELFINPYVKEEILECEDASDEFKCIIGAKIKGLRYLNSSLAKLNFGNGVSVLISYNNTEDKLESKNWFRITRSGQAELPRVGTAIKSINLWGCIRHAENSTFYRENTIVLNFDKGSYGLYAHSYRDGEANVRVEDIHKELVSGIHRRLGVNNPILIHVEYSDKAIKWICIKCNEGFLYIVTDGSTRVALFMSACESTKEEILHARHCTEGFKKIEFIEER